ncbi:MAG: glutamine amidotransferase [Planctomycetota bacterium]
MNGPSFFLQAADDLVDEGLRFSALPPNYVAWLLIPLGLVAFAWFFYKRTRGTPLWARVTLTALRVAAIFFVVLLLFDPYRQFRKVEEIRSMVTVLIDGSASMQRKEDYEQDPARGAAVRAAAGLPAGTNLREVSRSELTRGALGPEGLDLLGKLAEKHDVKTYVFSGGKPRPIGGLDEITDDGPITATGDAIAYVLSDPDVQAKPDASVVVVSDGRVNTGTDPVEVARYAGKKDRVLVHAIGVGDPSALRDIELRFIRADEVALKGSTVKLELVVRNSGYPSDWVTVTVNDQDGRPWVAPQTRKLEKSEGDQVIEIDVVARHVGSFTLEARIQGPAGEEDTANNVRTHGLVVKDDKIRVLYVDTLPRWEYRRLKNFVVRGDEAFQARALLLSAEPNFPQETSPNVEPLRQFPSTFEELDAYDVLIFGDVNPALLVSTPEKLTGVLRNIQRFVDSGGGLAVIAGEGWMPGAYVDTPFEELLPVDITFSPDDAPPTDFVEDWKPRLTALGREHPIVQITNDPEQNRRMWEEPDFIPLKALRWWYPTRKPTPGAQVIAVHPTQRNRFGPYPILVAGNYGDGPVLFSATDETWRWYYKSGATYFNRYWGNVIRYLARAHLYRGSKRYKLFSNRSEYRQGQSVQLTAYVKDKNFDPATEEIQRMMIAAPESKARMVELKKVRDGEYVHTFKPARFGRYEAWIVGEEGLAGKRYAPVAFDVIDDDPERRQPAMNEDGLRELAEASGAYFHPGRGRIRSWTDSGRRHDAPEQGPAPSP